MADNASTTNANDAPTEAAKGSTSSGGSLFKKRTGNANIRKKGTATPAVEDNSDTVVVKKNKGVLGTPLVASTKKEERPETTFAWASNPSAIPSHADQLAFAPDKDVDGNDTKTKDTDKNGQVQDTIKDGDSVVKIYHGSTSYTQWLNKSDKSGVAKGTGIGAGPVRASNYARRITLTDYAPDICKDYKETGYCGYGDSCKFMHDRGDYMRGWELDRQWDAEQKEREAAVLAAANGGGERGAGEEDEDADVPFACPVCREKFQTPVKPRCKHYHCEHCIRATCAVCDAPTAGVFTYVKGAEKQKLEKAWERHQLQEQQEGGDQDDE